MDSLSAATQESQREELSDLNARILSSREETELIHAQIHQSKKEKA